MAHRVSSPVLAGRATERAELVAAFERAAGGGPGVVLVGGEAGIGKTRLLAELTAHATGAGALVLQGQCAVLEDAAIPLLPVVDALRALPDGDDGGARGDDDDRDGVRLPADVRASPSGPASSELATGSVGRLHAHVLRRIDRASASGPVVLALEDLHWADRSTLDLVAFLARRLRDERILVVGTHRSDAVELRAGLRRFLADVGSAPIAQRLELAPLTLEETREQVAGIVGAPPQDELARTVHARAEGNPFFAEELVAASPNGTAGPLSPTLRDALLARIAALDPDPLAVVRVAAVGGREVHHALLAAAAALPEPALTEALRTAVRHHVLMARGDGFTFRHALLREAAYDELLPGERVRLHAAFAAALEGQGANAGGSAATVAAEVAHHWLSAGDDPRALAAAVRAGDEAERIGALAEAARHHRRALALWDAVPDAEVVAGVDRVTLLGRAANAPAWTGDPAEAIRFVDAAIALVDPAADPVRVAALYQRRGLCLWQLGRGGVEDFERAVALIPPEPPSAERARALGGLGLILMLAGRPGRSREACEAAIALARAVGAPGVEADALASLGDDVGRLGDTAAALRCLDLARDAAARAGDRDVGSRIAVPHSDLLLRAARPEQAIRVALAGAAEARRAGLEMRAAFCRLNAAEAALQTGRWDLAERICREVLAHAPSGVTRAFAHHIAGMVACARGDLAAAAAHLAGQRVAVGRDPVPPDYYALEAEAELAFWQRRPDVSARAASDGVRLVAEDAQRRALLATLGVRAEADRAEIARARRDADTAANARERAAVFRDIARQYARVAGHAAIMATAEAEHARADGRADPAVWHAAACAWDDRHAPYAAAGARWRAAEAALADRDRGAATEMLAAAHAAAVGLGATGLRAELEALARRARIDVADRAPREAVQAGGAAADLGLTAREREVLERLVLGRTNRQIAGELFISVRTAGVHVSHILAKLGAANRGEAAAIAHRLGLVSPTAPRAG